MTLLTFFRTSVGGISCFLLFAQLTFAASPPPNDHLSEATVIPSLPYTSSPQSVVAATSEPDESARSCGNAGGNDSVWYQYTPTTNQEVAFNTFGSNYDTVLSVWTGTTHPLVELGCNDDDNGTHQSFLHLFLNTGTTYYINVASYSGTDESSSLLLTVTPLVPADNDNLASAIQIATLPYTSANPYLWQSQTLETNEIPPSCAPEGYASVWYQYAPTRNQTVLFATDAPVLSIWNGATHPLAEIACNNSMASGSTSFPLELIADTTYYINLGMPDSSAGTRTLNVRELTQAGNNDWANATLIPTLPYEGKQPAQWATAEELEASASCDWEGQYNSVWYQYTPTTDQVINLEGTMLEETVWSSPKEMTVSIWNGTGHPLTELSCHRLEVVDSSPLLLKLTAETTYYFKVTTQSSGVLDFSLSVSPVTPPTNDDLAKATVISTLPYSNTSQEVFGSTNEDQELSSGCGEYGGSVWYQYTPTQNQTVVLSVLSEWSATVSVWTGTTHPLTELTCLDSGDLLKLTAGTTYFIKVSAPSNQKSLVSFEATEVTPPGNDDLAKATVISTLPYSNTSQEVFGSTNEDQELSSDCGESGGSVWYQYTPTQNQTVVLSVLSEWYASSVWTGTTHPLTELTCLNSGDLLKLTAGTTYFIKVSVPSNQNSLVSFEATEVTPPGNDDLANATVIPALPYSLSQSTQWATAEPGEVSYEQATSEDCRGGWGGEGFGDSVWYQYTPDHDQLVEFDTLGSSYDTVLSIWAGTTHPLTALVCNDDEYGVFLSQTHLKLTAHTIYYIRVNSGVSWWNDGGAGGMLNFYAQEVLPPSNDNLAQAISITSLPYTHQQNTQGASLETEEVTASCANSETGMSVWYKYTPTTSETVRLDTQTSSYDTVLSVWTGQPLTEIACHEDLSASDSHSKLIVTLTAGTTYLINVVCRKKCQ